MAAFNLLTAATSCPNCKRRATFDVQFRYGDTWQRQYVLGQKITWGGNDVGKPGYHRVRIEAIGGPCPYCKFDNLEFDILLEDDQITELVPVGIVRENEVKEGFSVEQAI